MKLYFFSWFTAGLVLASLANADIGPPDAEINKYISGPGGKFVCISQDNRTQSRKVYIARAATERAAHDEAWDSCFAKSGPEADCSRPTCAVDVVNLQPVRPVASAMRSSYRLTGYYNGLRTTWECMFSEHLISWGRSLTMEYLGRGATQVEAIALAIDVCLLDKEYRPEKGGDCYLQGCKQTPPLPNP